jgi:hypothetical protein
MLKTKCQMSACKNMDVKNLQGSDQTTDELRRSASVIGGNICCKMNIITFIPIILNATFLNLKFIDIRTINLFLKVVLFEVLIYDNLLITK